MNRSKSIDSLRFLAAGMVCLSHIVLEGKINFFVHDFILGKIGVVIFFLISGYLIPTSLSKEKSSLATFWVTRFFRLYPMYWASIIISIFVLNKIDITQILANITMFQSILGERDILGVYWTLIIEMFFYIFCSFLFALGLISKRKPVIISFAILTLLALLFGILRLFTDKNIPVAAPLLMAIMLIGYIIRLKERSITTKKDVILSISIFLFLLPLTAFTAYSSKDLNNPTAMYFFSYLAGIFIFFLFYTFDISSKITARLGEISYSTYLLHPLVIYFLLKSGIDKEINIIYFVLLYFAIVYLASEFAYRVIELPFIKIGKTLKTKNLLKIIEPK